MPSLGIRPKTSARQRCGYDVYRWFPNWEGGLKKGTTRVTRAGGGGPETRVLLSDQLISVIVSERDLVGMRELGRAVHDLSGQNVG